MRNLRARYLYQGEVKTIAVEENELRVKFSWIAKNEGYPHLEKWVKADDARLDYWASLDVYVATDMGPIGGGKSESIICLKCSMAGETVVLNPPNGSKLDPAKVEGLQLART